MLDQNENDLHQAEGNSAPGRTEGEDKDIIVDNASREEPQTDGYERPENQDEEEGQEEKNADQAAPAAAIEVNDAEVINEIDESNAEDAEDEDNAKRHVIPMLDYHAMDMEKLVTELEKLLKNEKVQAIKEHVDNIKYEFDLKFQELLEEKKEEFLNDGGNEIDFRYNSSVKMHFNKAYGEYKDKKNQYYKSLEQNLKSNLSKRLEIIEELKGLINVEENINTTYKHFKELQGRWKVAGPVPRISYNDVWRTYHHHVERFYDFLDLNRDLRDLDFKHNLEEKEKLIARAEELAGIPDVNTAFRELQSLHKIWKEDIGPVDREHREDIWNRFSAATKVIHEKRQDYFKNMDQIHEQNLVRKQEIIAQINAVAENKASSHNQWQKQIREIEALREAFFNAGRVPRKVNEEIWTAFKTAVRTFNRNKNEFYKNLKKDQHENLTKKQELIKIAQENKDSEDWEAVTPMMKKIQADWKKIGHVPRKYSDKIWAEFKAACNHYFDRLHQHKDEGNKEEMEALKQKEALLDKLKEFELSGAHENDVETVKEFISEWRSYGRVPYYKRNIENKFNKIIDALFKKLDVARQDIELIKYGNKLEQLANSDKDDLIDHERVFIRRKIDEVKGEIRQLENNLQFINADDTNPIVKEVNKNIDKHKEALALWKAKLQQLREMD
ncbi:DUF349 domain-containing protein [Sinomicrobium weinanense]|uniref:DUF349 domain-containing protein n=1 Tax=Sinomicrobium weinanense TaxID=2842200 RepID=A0A926JV88_9FLAO|nr:DUF349 domain-containing protein [Sinomicrobium weinanense]MBC9798210.1 DUF349 domain-containing protein [Sinomicrobium weinanense]MBU3122868.1 DUF349 domain-containing protein [Sinomicrobium weinanense]